MGAPGFHRAISRRRVVVPVASGHRRRVAIAMVVPFPRWPAATGAEEERACEDEDHREVPHLASPFVKTWCRQGHQQAARQPGPRRCFPRRAWRSDPSRTARALGGPVAPRHSVLDSPTRKTGPGLRPREAGGTASAHLRCSAVGWMRRCGEPPWVARNTPPPARAGGGRGRGGRQRWCLARAPPTLIVTSPGRGTRAKIAPGRRRPLPPPPAEEA